jgi:hypothetical protein
MLKLGGIALCLEPSGIDEQSLGKPRDIASENDGDFGTFFCGILCQFCAVEFLTERLVTDVEIRGTHC